MTETPGEQLTERPKLLKFHLSPDAGTPECICSLCRKPIEEDIVPTRLWPIDRHWEMRFHPECYSKIRMLYDYDFEWGDE